MSGKRTRSFKCAVHQRDREISSENDFHILFKSPPLFQRMVHAIAIEVLPDERDRKYYADNYSCCPPPVFVIFVTLIEVSSVYTTVLILLSWESFEENRNVKCCEIQEDNSSVFMCFLSPRRKENFW
jgi:hypothetical protein